MSVKLKPLNEQTIVITGATSGIGLVAARMAAQRGARLVLNARSEPDLRQLTDEIKQAGGHAIYVAADVADETALQTVADAAVKHFGGFDTWVNNAGVSIYGRLHEVSTEDQRQLFETNFWGVVNGSRIAAKHLRDRSNGFGGAIVNVGSALSDRAIPLQGMYCASKHAVKGFTDALRIELEEEGAPISVSLIKPAALDTPYKQHAKNYLPNEPENPPPVYAPDVAAEAILHCAQHSVRDVFAGGGGKMISVAGNLMPRWLDKLMELAVFKMQQSDRPERNRDRHSLYEPQSNTSNGSATSQTTIHSINNLQERGGYGGHVAESSVYTKASLYPVTTAALSAGATLAVAALARTALKRKPRRGISRLWS
jgi:short-subunit dehydrogenase